MKTTALKQKMKILGYSEAVRLSPGELAGWNVLSIRARKSNQLAVFPGARRTKRLHFDEVEKDDAGLQHFATKMSDIQGALEFSRKIEDEPLLIHCQAGISRSTAVAWIILYDKLKADPDAVRKSFDIVRELRPILSPDCQILRSGIEILVPEGNRNAVTQQFSECLLQLSGASQL
jgi:predicted protein tyrosine phosphatase